MATCTTTSSTESTAPTTSTSTFHSTRQYIVLNQQPREKYGLGESMIDKMGYPGNARLDISGQGNWYPLRVPDLLKPGHKPVIGDESDDQSHSSKKVNLSHYSSKVGI